MTRQSGDAGPFKLEWVLSDQDGRVLASGEAGFRHPSDAGEAYDAACLVGDQLERVLLVAARSSIADLDRFRRTTRRMRAELLGAAVQRRPVAPSGDGTPLRARWVRTAAGMSAAASWTSVL